MYQFRFLYNGILNALLVSIGMEVSPCGNCSNLQLHINGDISLAILQYLWATGNTASLDEAYVDILKGIALFWKNRLEHNVERGLYEIRGNQLLQCNSSFVYDNVFVALQDDTIFACVHI